MLHAAHRHFMAAHPASWLVNIGGLQKLQSTRNSPGSPHAARVLLPIHQAWMHTEIALRSNFTVQLGGTSAPALALLLCIRNGAMYM